VDVHFAEIAARREAEADRLPTFDALLAEIAAERDRAQAALCAAARPKSRRNFGQLAKRLIAALRKPEPLTDGRDLRSESYTLAPLARRVLPPLVERLTKPDRAALADVEQVHRLRIDAKKLRYSLELLAGTLAPRRWSEIHPSLEEFQERLGDLNDAHELSTRAAASSAPGAAELADEYRKQRDRLHAEFLDRWFSGPGDELRAGLVELANGMDAAMAAAQVSPTAPIRRHRVAALDVGTNSVRLVIAETDPARTFRVIEDVKESTRLGAGMFEDGRLSPEAVDRTIAAIGRLRAIAENHRVDALRAIGTAAVREAKNGAEFVARAQTEADVTIEVVDAEKEARLAFASVAGAMDLSRRRVAVADIGGGSTEVIFSAGGLIDAVYSLRIGAVRLTERFAHLQADPEAQFAAMRDYAAEIVHAGIPNRPYPVEAIVGTGGTFSNLARLAVRNGAATTAGGRFLFAVSGCELPRGEVVRLLDWLRRMTLEERKSLAGLSAQRADIIVAGVAIVERLMDRLGVERLQVHDGGVRDGLLAETIDDLGIAAAPEPRKPTDALASARAYLKRLDLDQTQVAHAEHVAHLSLHLFDKLADLTRDASGAWAGPEARLLLEIAALLHDCGQAVAYANHHRHGRDMIRAADLPTLTRREREIVALAARYHRRGGPRDSHTAFARLSPFDQRLLLHLVGVLRIADGLDRTHRQEVDGVDVEISGDRATVHAHAAAPPNECLRAARKKADVFRRAFHADVAIEWDVAKAPKPE
jgi:exopolyphosphatase/guanosine-5'-triphosphate,3'-diphosphate pyrophosphatase